LSSSSGRTASHCSCCCLEVSVRCLCLSVCLVTLSTRSVGRFVSHTFLISRMLTKMQVARCWRIVPII
ncbi:hypothetical protein GQ42DRAFT_162668, partial [Ramicandelaber brevisporus]